MLHTNKDLIDTCQVMPVRTWRDVKRYNTRCVVVIIVVVAAEAANRGGERGLEFDSHNYFKSKH